MFPKKQKLEFELPRLVVHPSHRYLSTEDGKPFFWLGDTCWWIRRIPYSQREDYLSIRKGQGYNLLQVHCGYQVSDYAGNRAFLEDKIDHPDESYWSTMDQIITQAASHHFYVALAPMWGQEYGKAFGIDESAAERFGYWIGKRYGKYTNVIWIVSGEYDALNNFHLPISLNQKRLFNSVAEGIQRGHEGRQLMTIHPGVARTSSLDFHAESWLDFNMLQSGHMNDCLQYDLPENFELIAEDYRRLPIKPVVDGEPFYEDTPDGVWSKKTIHGPRADAAAMRRKAYGSVFAGAFGHTYGHNDVYGFFEPTYPGQVVDLPEGPGQRGDWRISLMAEGAQQMKHLRNLIEAHSFFDRIPDDDVILSDRGNGLASVKATRNERGNWLMVYLPFGKPVRIDLTCLSGEKFLVSWFDPRDGSTRLEDCLPDSNELTLSSPTLDEDWVLTVDGIL